MAAGRRLRRLGRLRLSRRDLPRRELSLTGRKFRRRRRLPGPADGRHPGDPDQEHRQLGRRSNHERVVWKHGTVTPFLPGVAWIRPTASPTGGQITYAVRGTDGLPHVYLVDTGTRKVVQVTNTAAADPVFLSPGYVWYTGLQLCNPPGSCAY